MNPLPTLYLSDLEMRAAEEQGVPIAKTDVHSNADSSCTITFTFMGGRQKTITTAPCEMVLTKAPREIPQYQRRVLDFIVD